MFSDPFEGSFSRVNLEQRPHVYKDLDPEQYEKMIFQLSESSKWMREWTYINCWHSNEYESAAMWDLYGKSNEAVAIETNYQKLVDVLPESTFIGLVRYIDYDKEWLPEGNTFYPFLHKRKSFEHEKEIRIVMQKLPQVENRINIGAKNGQLGIDININLNQLITCIHVSPTAPSWFVRLTEEIVNKYKIDAPVRKSDLYSEPVF